MIIQYINERLESDENRYLVSKNKSKLSNNEINKESIVAGYLNQLPKNYLIFSDVKFPGIGDKINHIVMGPKGIFVIETKNFNGFYIVRGENWYYKRKINKKGKFSTWKRSKEKCNGFKKIFKK